MSKKEESELLAYLVEEWKQGHKVEIPIEMFKSNIIDRPAVRCYICDWSPSNPNSLYNVDVVMSKHNKLFHGDDGRTICYECISASEAIFRGKTIRDVEGDYSLENETKLGMEYDEDDTGA